MRKPILTLSLFQICRGADPGQAVWSCCQGETLRHCCLIQAHILLIDVLCGVMVNDCVQPAAPAMAAAPSGPSTAFAPFAGSGKRLDGKSNASSSSLVEEGKQTQIPEAFCVKDYKPGE